MAAGPVQHLGFTLFSTSGSEGLTAKLAEGGAGTNSQALGAPITDNLNNALGVAVFNACDQAYGVRPSDTALKLVDGYADLFLSSEEGVAAFGDLGVDILKAETPNVDVGIGFRLDTGINVGSKGARVCFLGVGGEACFTPAETGTKEAGMPLPTRITGFGFEFWVLKVMVLWA